MEDDELMERFMLNGTLFWVGCRNCGCPVDASVPANRYVLDLLNFLEEALEFLDKDELRESMRSMREYCYEEAKEVMREDPVCSYATQKKKHLLGVLARSRIDRAKDTEEGSDPAEDGSASEP